MLVEHAFGRTTRWLIWGLLGAAIAEIGAAAFCWFLLIPSHAGRFLWHPDLEEARNNWSAFSASADEEIGGATIFSEASGAPRDLTGAKQNLDFPDTAHACGSAYGESLVLGYEVAAASVGSSNSRGCLAAESPIMPSITIVAISPIFGLLKKKMRHLSYYLG